MKVPSTPYRDPMVPAVAAAALSMREKRKPEQCKGTEICWVKLGARGLVKRTRGRFERCKGCGFCVEFCPTHVLALSSAFNSKGYHPPHVVEAERCSGCDLCGMYCPDFAIFGARHAR